MEEVQKNVRSKSRSYRFMSSAEPKKEGPSLLRVRKKMIMMTVINGTHPKSLS